MPDTSFWSQFVVLLKTDLDVQQTFLSRGGFVEQMLLLRSSFKCDQIYKCQRFDFGHTPEVGLSNIQVSLVAHQSVTKVLLVIVMNLVTPKGGAKLELLFNEPVLGHLQLISSLSLLRTSFLEEFLISS